MATQQFTGVVEIISCGECGVPFGLDRDFMQERRKDHRTWYCPNGHSRHYPTENEAEKLRRELATVRDTAKWYENAYQNATSQNARLERVVSAKKGTITKLKRRAANGVCPCCTRTFGNLARHMATKHPGFGADAALPESGIEAAP